MLLRWLQAACAACSVLALAGCMVTVVESVPGPPVEITLFPIADTYVRNGSQHRDTSFADDVVLEIKLDRPEEQPNLNRKAFVAYDLSSVNRQVVQATMRFYVTRRSTMVEPSVLVSGITDVWEAESLTWNNAPHTGGVEIGTYVVPRHDWLEIDVTDYVNSQLEVGWVSFRIESITNHPEGYIDLVSSRGEEQFRPHMIVIY